MSELVSECVSEQCSQYVRWTAHRGGQLLRQEERCKSNLCDGSQWSCIIAYCTLVALQTAGQGRQQACHRAVQVSFALPFVLSHHEVMWVR